MYYIEARNDSYKWISAIFMDREKVESYLQSIPERLKNIQTLHEVSLDAYPVYLVEGDEFFFRDLAGVHAALGEIEVKPDFEHVYLNLYKISEDFQSRKPGTDYMGALSHVHVDNDFMQRYHKAAKGSDPFDL